MGNLAGQQLEERMQRLTVICQRGLGITDTLIVGGQLAGRVQRPRIGQRQQGLGKVRATLAGGEVIQPIGNYKVRVTLAVQID